MCEKSTDSEALTQEESVIREKIQDREDEGELDSMPAKTVRKKRRNYRRRDYN